MENVIIEECIHEDIKNLFPSLNIDYNTHNTLLTTHMSLL